MKLDFIHSNFAKPDKKSKFLHEIIIRPFSCLEIVIDTQSEKAGPGDPASDYCRPERSDPHKINYESH